MLGGEFLTSRAWNLSGMGWEFACSHAHCGNMCRMENEHLIAKTTSSDETKKLAVALARCLQSGDVVLLTGDLGAGKTQFVQGVASGLGASQTPISPTFNIVLTYDSGRIPLHHFDLYRLEEYAQLEDIALREYLEGDGVCFIEWAEKFPRAFDEYLAIRIEKTGEAERAIWAGAEGPHYEELLDAWGSAASGSSAVPETERSDCALSQLAQKELSGRIGAHGSADDRYVLAFDTANEVVAIGVGVLDAETRTVQPAATRQISAHRASNTTLVPAIDALLFECGVARAQIACVCVGRGPGSFTGVRIAMATAKGIAQALGRGLVGVSTLDAIAFNAQAAGVRGEVLVIADAMRKEVYPVRYLLFDDDVRRLSADRVVKAAALADELAGECSRNGECSDGSALDLFVIGDGLVKYRDLYEPHVHVLDEALWNVTGDGLLKAFEAAWRAGSAEPVDAVHHDPGLALPVYTRLSDAEENERIRLSKTDEKNLVTGVQDVAPDDGVGRATMHASARLAAVPDGNGISYMPLSASHVDGAAALDSACMGMDAWSAKLIAGELGQRNRTWWVAESDGELVGYAGGMVVDGDVQILKVVVDPAFRRRGIARELLARVSDDARNLGAQTCSLEVRASNVGAQAFYAALGLASLGVRPGYYPDREDAVIMSGALPSALHDVAGMELKHLTYDGAGSAEPAATADAAGRSALSGASDVREQDGDACPKCSQETFAHEASQQCGASSETLDFVEGDRGRSERPLILAIESSCDETAAAIVDGAGNLLSDVVASQIDFHSRFGGVVPEIASRKHIEAICGVCAEALDATNIGPLAWDDIDAVAVTYAPGLLGALVVGVAYAKGAAWALDVPFIGVNHLEGHLYANKIGAPDFTPPAVVSLVSGGNTMLVHMRDWGVYETLGATIDDAVGEAFDKVAKALGLGYPGGPVISKQAAMGDPDAIAFPRAMLHSHDFRFSLSGLKTAVVSYINNERAAGHELNIPDIAASFQQAVVDVQVAKARTALRETGAPTFCLGGGVAANPVLRAAYEDMCAKEGVRLIMPPLSSCGDNAGMIALVALDRFKQGKIFSLDADAAAHANLDESY